MNQNELVGPVVVHSAGEISYANDEFGGLVGVESPADLVGESLSAYVAEEYLASFRRTLSRLTDGAATALGIELELETAGGRERDVLAVSSPIDWDEQSQIHTSCIDLSHAGDGTAVALRENAMDEAPIGITIADATREDGTLVYVNDGFVELTGYPQEEIIGQNCRFLQGEATRSEPVAELRRAIENEEPATVELRNYRKDGSMFWNRVTIAPMEDEHGDVTHFMGYQEDISESKVCEREKSLFEAHAEASDQAMLVTDRDGIIEYVNPAFEQTTGYTAAEAIGQNPRILKSGHQDESFYETLWETLEAGDIWEAELTNHTKSGEVYHVEQTIVPIVDDRGEVTHFIAIERDITDERITNQVLDVLNRVLRHNVRTSINVIDGYTDMLETDLNEAERQVALDAIRARTDALEKISEQTTAIRNLMEGSKEPTPLALSQIEDIAEKFRTEHPKTEIDVVMPADVSWVIRNGGVFEVALDAAIENAIKHNDEPTPVIDITVSAPENGETATVEIADNGPGIPDSEWRVITAGKETPLQHTSGIGLWLLYWAMAALGGTVELVRSDSSGSLFRVKVPVDRSSEPA